MTRLGMVCAGCLVSLFPIASFAQDAEEHTEYLFAGIIGHDAYNFQVIGKKLPLNENQKLHPERAGKGVYSRSVHIDCIEKCKCEPHYVQELENGGPAPWGGGPMSIVELDDDDAQVMTTWSNGHLYSIKIYGCVDGKIKLTLQRSSKTMPSYRLDENGASLISLSESEETGSSATVDLHWNGKTYVVRHIRK